MRSRLHIALLVTVIINFVTGCLTRDASPMRSVQQQQPTPRTDAVTLVYERPTFIRVVSKATGKEITQGIDIYEDGRCFVRRVDGTELEKRVSPSTVAQLLTALEHNGFFSLSPWQIDRKVEAAQRAPSGGYHIRGVTDCNFSGVFARTDSQTNVIERYALEHELKWYPEIREACGIAPSAVGFAFVGHRLGQRPARGFGQRHI